MPNVKLQSSDMKEFTIDVEVAKVSVTVNDMLENLGVNEEVEEIIPLANVTGDILEKVVEWAIHHHKDDPTSNGVNNKSGSGMSEWDENFLKVDQETLYALTRAANFMDIKGLLDLCCKAVANMIKGKTSKDIRLLFGLPWTTIPEINNSSTTGST